MNFTKMHGLGNDFMLIYTPTTPDFTRLSALAPQMCDRHTGVGADGIAVLYPSAVADIAMRIINSDGSIAEQCGNAMRCVAKYFYERLSGLKTHFTIESKIGVQPVWIETEAGVATKVRIDMGPPILEPARIPLYLEGDRAVEQTISVAGQSFTYTAVSMGNPHMVIAVRDAAAFPVNEWGPVLETHPLFPNKTNVEFVTYHSPEEVTMRVWERGAGPTLACGSGACATVVAGVLTGQTARKAVVHLPAGDLLIDWNEQDGHVYMTGPAAFVYDGVWLGK
ncbi:diaminopimelate epimerase [Laceyella putida]|uniref:Diaminopimelate epimerase n=1 Tax=Laceyella putida TaxID=110101 RepID=A0ABW2RMU1_9BACL